MASEQRAVVKYEGIEYELPTDLTERERFDAERLSGRSIDEIGKYTRVLLMGYFALRRANILLSFDEYLDGGGFELDTRPPLGGGSPDANDHCATDGPPTSPPSSEYTPGT